MRRDCPRCHVPLVPERREVFLRNVTVDACPKCNGLFLDEGEIKSLTGNRALHVLLTKRLEIDSDSPLVCPSCGGIMDLEDAAGVAVDVCLTCHGIWLDAKELELLKGKSPAEFRELSEAKLAELYDEKRAKARDRRGFLEQFFGSLRKRG